MRGIVLSILGIIVMGNLAYGQTYDEGKEAVMRFDFYGAQRIFRSLEYKQPLEHRVGEVFVFSDEKSPFRNLDSALFYIQRARSAQKYNGTSDSLVRADLLVLEKEISNDLLLEVSSMGVTELNQVLFLFHDLQGRSEIQKRRDTLAYLELQKDPTWVKAQMLQLAYPNTIFNDEVQFIYDSAYYTEHTQGFTIDELLAYKELHSETPYLDDIDNRIFDLFIDGSNSINVYYSFVNTYPSNINVREAWLFMLDEFLRVDPTEERLIAFQADYPDFPYTALLDEKKALLGTKLLPVSLNEKWGYASTDGNVILDYSYDWAGFFGDGLAPVLEGDFVSYINKEGKVMISLALIDGSSFVNKHAIAESNDGVGLINVLGEWMIPDTLESIEWFSKDILFLYGEDDEYLFSINSGFIGAGEEVVPLENLLSLKNDSVFWLFDFGGRQVGEVYAEDLEDFNGSILRVETKEGVQLWDVATNEWLGDIYEEIGRLDTISGLAAVSDGELYGYINTLGTEKVTLKYKLNSQSLKTYRYENGYAKFKWKGKFGMRDRKQRKVLPAIFLQIGQYDSLIPIIKEVDKWGYCDEEADLQIEYNYGYAENFVNRKAVVGSNGKYGVIGVQGDTLLPIEYTNIYRIRNLFACENEDGWWLLDSNLQVLNITPISRILKDNPVYLVLEMVNSRVYYWDWNKRAILRLN